MKNVAHKIHTFCKQYSMIRAVWTRSKGKENNLLREKITFTMVDGFVILKILCLNDFMVIVIDMLGFLKGT